MITTLDYNNIQTKLFIAPNTTPVLVDTLALSINVTNNMDNFEPFVFRVVSKSASKKRCRTLFKIELCLKKPPRERENLCIQINGIESSQDMLVAIIKSCGYQFVDLDPGVYPHHSDLPVGHYIPKNEYCALLAYLARLMRASYACDVAHRLFRSLIICEYEAEREPCTVRCLNSYIIAWFHTQSKWSNEYFYLIENIKVQTAGLNQNYTVKIIIRGNDSQWSLQEVVQYLNSSSEFQPLHIPIDVEEINDVVDITSSTALDGAFRNFNGWLPSSPYRNLEDNFSLSRLFTNVVAHEIFPSGFKLSCNKLEDRLNAIEYTTILNAAVALGFVAFTKDVLQSRYTKSTCDAINKVTETIDKKKLLERFNSERPWYGTFRESHESYYSNSTDLLNRMYEKFHMSVACCEGSIMPNTVVPFSIRSFTFRKMLETASITKREHTFAVSTPENNEEILTYYTYTAGEDVGVCKALTLEEEIQTLKIKLHAYDTEIFGSGTPPLEY